MMSYETSGYKLACVLRKPRCPKGDHGGRHLHTVAYHLLLVRRNTVAFNFRVN